MSARALSPLAVPALRERVIAAFRATPLDRGARRSQESDLAARWRRILYGDTCVYCRGPVETLDHIRPRAAGGPNDWWNLAGACKACNRAKSDLPLLVYMLDRERRRRALLRRSVAPPRQHSTRPREMHRFGLFADRLAAAIGGSR